MWLATAARWALMRWEITSLKLYRREFVDSGIPEHHGRIVKTTAMGCRRNSPVWWMRAATLKSSVTWSGATSVFPQKDKSHFELESTSAILLLMATIFLAMVSISRPVWKHFANLADFVFQGRRTTISGIAFDGFRRSRRTRDKEYRARGGRPGLSPRISRQFRNQLFPSSAEDASNHLTIRYEQEIHFCQTGNGVQLAYARIGQGLSARQNRALDDPASNLIYWRHLYQRIASRSFLLPIRRSREWAVGS